MAPSSLHLTDECPDAQPNDLSRSLVALDQDSTIIAVVDHGWRRELTPAWPPSQPLPNQPRQRTILHQYCLCIVDRVPECRISFPHADTEALAGNTGLNDLEPWAVAHEPFRTGASFMNTSQPPIERSSSAFSISS